jgi:rubrerythrin/predicted phosphodiesterase
MEKITTNGIKLNGIKSFTLIGDPGCDGLGAEIMSKFNTALRCASGDFIIIAGDIVPKGNERFYKSVIEISDGAAAGKPVYMVCGNHDTDDYEMFFGNKNYYMYDEHLLLVVLDNSKRIFSEEALSVLSEALNAYARDTIALSFHIPPPNRVSGNSVSAEEWQKVVKIIAPFREKIKYILCGHIHSYFEDDVDGIKLIATGGGGARIEDVEGITRPYNHYVEFEFNTNYELHHKKKDISFYSGEDTSDGQSRHTAVRSLLEEAFTNECKAHVRYRIYAEDALRQGKPGLAQLLLATSDSEYYHALNHFFTMNEFKNIEQALDESIASENYEVSEMYKSNIETARAQKNALAVYSFSDALEAEKVHRRLLTRAKETLETARDIPEKQYYTCTSCGWTFDGEADSCPVCGAPKDKIKAVSRV